MFLFMAKGNEILGGLSVIDQMTLRQGGYSGLSSGLNIITRSLKEGRERKEWKLE